MIKKVSKLVVLLAVMALFAGVIAGCGQQAQQQQGQESKGTVELGYVWIRRSPVPMSLKVLEDQGYEVKITAVDASPMWLGKRGNLMVLLPPGCLRHKDYYAQVKDKVEDLANLKAPRSVLWFRNTLLLTPSKSLTALKINSREK